MAAYLFTRGGRRLARVSRDEWEWASCLAGNDPEIAAGILGLEAPRGVRVLWGRSSRQALREADGAPTT